MKNLFTTKLKVFLLLVLVGALLAKTGTAQTLEEEALNKIKLLTTLIEKAKLENIEVLPEQTTVRTAEIFLKYANWDEGNIAENTALFEEVTIYKDSAERTAKFLPDFERREIVLMLEDAIAYLTQLMDKKVFRKPMKQVDWTEVTLEGDQLTFDDAPVFLADWTWKPRTRETLEFHGNEDGFFISPTHVSNSNGGITKWITDELKTKEDGSIGFIFLNNKNLPGWAKTHYGNGFGMREDTYTAYDIDHPGAREMMGNLVAGTVPYMAGKKYSEMGYMMCNEPHFITTENSWATGPVSDYSIAKFKVWLANKHASIDALNVLWGSSFSGFDDVTITIPISADKQGTAEWYDWVRFNNYRVTEWYKWLKAELIKHDPNAKVHLKIMPNLWSENGRNHGLDIEALTELSGIVGNDAGSNTFIMWGKTPEWAHHYSMDWREMCMTFDFFKSVSPNKINYNTEAHYLSTVRSRNLFQQPKYARATYWLAHTQGLTASQTWFWARREDGSIRNNAGKGYGGSNNQQPRVVNEVHTTMLDLNTYSKEIMAMQRQRKPLRVFHSETSAISKAKHMDDEFSLYEQLFFEGTPIGFATENIIKLQNNANWDAILIYKTEFVTSSELAALQTYLDNGGTVITDAVSLKKNEYGKAHTTQLTASNGKLLEANSLEAIKTKAMDVVTEKKLLPAVSINETNANNAKACTWKCIPTDKGSYILSIVNLGNTVANLNVVLQGAKIGTSCKNLLTGIDITTTPKLQPQEVLFIEVADKKSYTTGLQQPSDKVNDTIGVLYPNPTKGEVNIQLNKAQKQVRLLIYSADSRVVMDKEYTDVRNIRTQLPDGSQGLYLVKLESDGINQSFTVLKD